MNAIVKSILIGIAAVIAGFIFAALFWPYFTEFPSDTAIIIAMNAYLCFVVVVCTGIIISKLDKK